MYSDFSYFMKYLRFCLEQLLHCERFDFPTTTTAMIEGKSIKEGSISTENGSLRDNPM
jgi:hypothetical protein